MVINPNSTLHACARYHKIDSQKFPSNKAVKELLYGSNSLIAVLFIVNLLSADTRKHKGTSLTMLLDRHCESHALLLYEQMIEILQGNLLC